MKIFLLNRASLQFIFIVIAYVNVRIINSFVVPPKHVPYSFQSVSTAKNIYRSKESSSDKRRSGSPVLFSSTSTKPLYDGTNYTFPDTQTAAGVAELLEVSFVHACIQLASGYVDVLKLFIASSIGAYEAGFSIDSIIDELENNVDMPNTANRLLMDEEKMLRRDWLCVVYLTLAAMDHSSPMTSVLAMHTAKKSIPEDIKEKYGELVTRLGEAYKNGNHRTLSVQDLNDGGSENLTQLEKAVLLQSLKVATLTPVVVEEAKESYGSKAKKQKNNEQPPTPPIEGAF